VVKVFAFSRLGGEFDTAPLFSKGVSPVSVPQIDTVAFFDTGLGMARKLRIEYAGAIYHLMNRGDRREPIFLDDVDRRTGLFWGPSRSLPRDEPGQMEGVSATNNLGWNCANK